MDALVLAAVGIGAGILGAMVGLGGGVLLVPVLSLFLGISIHEAIAASLVAVVATSTSTAVSYVRHGYSNARLGLTLETATTVGAILGGLTGAALNRSVLSGIFGVVLLAVSVYMFYKRKGQSAALMLSDGVGHLGGAYYDEHLHTDVTYRIKRLPIGLVGSFLAGNLSGLLGIGGGPIKVPTMTLGMGIPIKAAAATSNFMIGITAAASAYIYYTQDFVNPKVAIPVALGVALGAYIGSRIAPRVSGSSLTVILAVVLILLSVQMLLASVGIQFNTGS